METEPKEVCMVWHQAIGGTGELVAVAGVEEKLSECGVVSRVEPAGGALLKGHRPMDGGVSAIGLGGEAREAGLGRRRSGGGA